MEERKRLSQYYPNEKLKKISRFFNDKVKIKKNTKNRITFSITFGTNFPEMWQKTNSLSHICF